MRLFFSSVGFCIFMVHLSLSQVVTENYILSDKPTLIEKIKMPKSDTIMVVPFGFGDFIIQNQKILDSINRKPIAKIVMVYTRYKKSAEFSQEELNRNRLEQFRKQCPYIFENNLISWELIEQTGAKNDEEAKKYFHGFLIYFRGKMIKKELTTAEEIAMIKARVGDHCRVSYKDTIRDLSKLYSSKKIEVEAFIMSDTIIKLIKGKFVGKYIPYTQENLRRKERLPKEVLEKIIIQTDVNIVGFYESVQYRIEMRKENRKILYDPKSKAKKAIGKLYRRRSVWNRAIHYDTIVTRDTLWFTLDTAYRAMPTCVDLFRRDCMESIYGFGGRYSPDSVVRKTLPKIRNQENTIVVEDVTGSMSPYLLQTFLWRRMALATSKLSRFVFFNDGDGMSDGAKIIGRTGGIYSINSINVDSVESVAYGTMKKGGGGDCPENNIEALLHAEKECPECNLLMIADNYAPVKDIILLNKLTKPVQIILCGASANYYQSDYLTIARATKGSIYTMEGELTDVVSAPDGSRIKVGSQYFIIKDGRFILTR